MGEDTLYSGTVAAAVEGVMFGVPGVAFSQIDRGWNLVDDAAKAAHDIVAQMLASKLAHTEGAATLLNVNIPNRPYADLGRWRVTRLGNRHHSQPVVVQRVPEVMKFTGSGLQVMLKIARRVLIFMPSTRDASR